MRELAAVAPGGAMGGMCVRIMAMLADGDLGEGARRALLRGIVDSFRAQGILGRYLEIEPVSGLGETFHAMVSDTAREMARERSGGPA